MELTRMWGWVLLDERDEKVRWEVVAKTRKKKQIPPFNANVEVETGRRVRQREGVHDGLQQRQ